MAASHSKVSVIFGTTNGNYIGFDCAHLGDWTPFDFGLGDKTYKDTNFVLNELKHIVKQLKEKQK